MSDAPKTYADLLAMVARFDFLDFPTAWAIQEADDLPHNDKCSSTPGSNGGMGGSAFLCDCGAVTARWAYLRAELGMPHHDC